jgi:hypothetical protein
MKLIEFILKWQTLIGSIAGGVFALLTALIVARSARRRDELASAMIVSATLAAVRVVSETLAVLSAQEGVTEETLPLWFAEKIAHSHPSLPVLFDASASRLMPIDVSLAAHLSLFQQTYSQTESVLKRITDDYTYYHMHGKPFRPQDLMAADCRIATKHFEFAAEHANCAVYLISTLVLSKFAFWYKLRRHIWSNKKEKECMELLRKGTS